MKPCIIDNTFSCDIIACVTQAIISQLKVLSIMQGFISQLRWHHWCWLIILQITLERKDLSHMSPFPPWVHFTGCSRWLSHPRTRRESTRQCAMSASSGVRRHNPSIYPSWYQYIARGPEYSCLRDPHALYILYILKDLYWSSLDTD